MNKQQGKTDPITAMDFDLHNMPFSLVLSGGGALATAHLGVLHDLERQSMVPAEVVGTSMGGIIGACLAIGMREAEILTRVKEMGRFTSWIKFSAGGNALIDTAKIAAIFDSVFGQRQMSDTRIPLKVIATNLRDGGKKVFDARDSVVIRDALLATMAIPGIFKEHVIDGEVYGDGFLSENLGLTEADFQHVLAVDVLGKNAFQRSMPDGFFKTANVLEMFEKSMRLLIYNQTRNHLRHVDKTILLLEPDTSEYRSYQFHKVDEIRHLGLGLLPA